MAVFLERVYAKCEREGECLLWKSPAVDKDGYPLAKFEGKTVQVHRAVYEVLHGPIPEGMCVAQTCNRHNCLEDNHLSPMTRSEVGLRAKAATCKRGHPREGNLFFDSSGRRRCRECLRSQTNYNYQQQALPQITSTS